VDVKVCLKEVHELGLNKVNFCDNWQLSVFWFRDGYICSCSQAVLCPVSGKIEEGRENVYSMVPVSSFEPQGAMLCCRVLGSVFE
jgi:hypothetical protein